MNLQWSQRTSGVGAGAYCASCFDSPQILGIRLAGILLRAAPQTPTTPLWLEDQEGYGVIGSTQRARDSAGSNGAAQ
jgi:hypothetical protein